MPSKGATMRMRASCALDSATWASATSSAAALWSTALWLTKFSATSSRLRCRLVRAMLACASDCFSCACCSVSSSCTSNWPRLTRWPSPKPSAATRPLTSGRSTTPWRDCSEPTACASSASVMASTLPTSTLTGPPGRAAARRTGARPRLRLRRRTCVVGRDGGGPVLPPPCAERQQCDAQQRHPGMDLLQAFVLVVISAL